MPGNKGFIFGKKKRNAKPRGIHAAKARQELERSLSTKITKQNEPQHFKDEQTAVPVDKQDEDLPDPQEESTTLSGFILIDVCVLFTFLTSNVRCDECSHYSLSCELNETSRYGLSHDQQHVEEITLSCTNCKEWSTKLKTCGRVQASVHKKKSEEEVSNEDFSSWICTEDAFCEGGADLGQTEQAGPYGEGNKTQIKNELCASIKSCLNTQDIVHEMKSHSSVQHSQLEGEDVISETLSEQGRNIKEEKEDFDIVGGTMEQRVDNIDLHKAGTPRWLGDDNLIERGGNELIDWQRNNSIELEEHGLGEQGGDEFIEKVQHLFEESVDNAGICHVMEVDIKGKLKCHLSDKEYVRKSDLMMHTRTHTKKVPHNCDVCGKGFRFKNGLVAHKRSHKGEKPYKCEVCGKAFSGKRHLVIHKISHSEERPYKCVVCGETYSTTGCLRIHYRTHTGERPYRCDVCGKGCISSKALKSHKITHTGEKQYKCDMCGKGFCSYNYLQTHKRTHTGEKPYMCDVCGKGFHNKKYLKNHERTHTGEKPYMCDMCGLRFTKSYNMNVHKRTHTEEKPYQCDMCDERFNHNVSLKNHQRMHR